MPQSTYAELRRGLDTAREQGYQFEDLPAYVRFLAGGDQNKFAEYGAGATDGWLKEVNYRLNQAINLTGLPAAGGEFGAGVANIFGGSPDAGRQAGEKIARGGANLIPLLLTGGSSLPVQAAGAVGAGGLAGLDVYGEGGTPGQAITTGLLTAAIPAVAAGGSRVGAFLSGAPKVEGIATAATPTALGAVGDTVSTYLPQTFGQRLASYTGAQVASQVPFAGMEYIEAKREGREAFTKDWWIANLIGQVPFMVGDVPRLTTALPDAKLVQATLDKRVASTPKPPIVPVSTTPPNPETVAAADKLLASMNQKSSIAADVTIPQSTKDLLTRAADLQQNVILVTDKEGKLLNLTQLGTPFTPRVDEVTFSGKVVHELAPNPTNPNSKGSYLVEVATANKLGYVGKTMHVPKNMVKVNEDGSMTIATRFFNEARTKGPVVVDTGTPELPVQETPGEIKPGSAAETLTGKKGDLPIQPEGDPDWTTPIPEFEARIRAAEAKWAQADALVKSLPEVQVVDLETAKAALVAADKVNDQLDNAVRPVADTKLNAAVEEQVAKGENLSDASTVVVQAETAKAKQRVEDTKQKLTREQKKLMRQAETALAYDQIEQGVRGYRSRINESDNPDAEQVLAGERPREADEIQMLEDAFERHGNKMGGRMIDFVDELKSAYVKWVQAGRPGKEPKGVLGRIIQTVLKRLEQGKVITGGKVLRTTGKWSETGKRGETQLYNSRAEAKTQLDLAKTLQPELQNPVIMTRGDKFYLMERPRQQSVEFDPTSGPSVVDVGGKTATLPKEPTATKDAVKDIPKVPEVKKAVQEQSLAITRMDVEDAVRESGESVTEDYIAKAGARLAILNQAILEGKVPMVPRSNKDGETYQRLLQEQGLEFPDMDQAQDFAISDVVQILRGKIVDGLKQPVAEAVPEPDLLQQNPNIPLGGGFVWGMGNYDPVTNTLNGKHKLPKTGVVPVAQFKNMAGRGKPLPDAELELAKLVVPEAFSETGVDVRKLFEGLKDPARQPVTTVTYGMEGKQSPEKLEFDQLTHEWFDNLSRDQQHTVSLTEIDVVDSGKDFDESYHKYVNKLGESEKVPKDKVRRWIELNKILKDQPADSSPRATSYYRQISPYDTEQYPPVRVDVALPLKREYTKEEAAHEMPEEDIFGPSEEMQQADRAVGNLWPPDNLHENLPNTLGWAMVQFVPDPKTGETVAFVGEQQSRWGQEQRQLQEELKGSKPTGNVRRTAGNTRWEVELEDGTWIGSQGTTKEAALQDIIEGVQASRDKAKQQNHPLLPLQHVLILKAVAVEAAKRGVKKVVVSDGETAMMTEGHDKWLGGWRGDGHAYKTEAEAKVAAEEYKRDNPKEVEDHFKLEITPHESDENRFMFMWEPTQPTQAGGMRLHYDRTLPSAMKKLTGEEGQAWEGGVHKNVLRGGTGAVFDTDANLTNMDELRSRANDVLGSPVFRDSSGQPKSTITGRIYNLQNAFQNMQQRGGFTVADPAFATPTAELTPEQSAKIVELNGQDAVGYLEGMVQRSDPKSLQGALGKILLQYKDQFQNIPVSIIPGSSKARFNPNTNTIEIGANYFRSMQGSDYVYPHEITHALSVKLLREQPNHPAVAELERLRQHGISALPKEVRDLFDHWETNDLFSKARSGEAVDWGVDTKDAWFKVLYGLTNNEEFVAQAYSSPEFQGWASQVKVPAQKRSFLKWFTDTIAKLFGKSDHAQLSSLLEQSIVAGNRVFDSQRSLIHHEQVSKQILLDQGMAPALIPLRVASLNQMVEVVPVGTNEQQSRTYLRWLSDQFKMDRASGLFTPLERQANDLANKLWQQMPEEQRAEQLELLREVQSEIGKDPTEAFVGVTNLDSLPEEFWTNLAPASVRQLEALSRYGLTQMEILATQERAAQEQLNNVRPAHNLAAIEQAKQRFESLMRGVRKAQQDASDVLSLNRLTADGFFQTVMNGEAAQAVGAEDVVGPLLGEPTKDKELGWFSRNIKPIWQIAQDHPEMKAAVGGMFDYRGQVAQNLNRIFAHLSMKAGEDGIADWNKDTQAQFEKFMVKPELVKPVDDILRLRQDKRDFLTSTDPKDKVALESVLRGRTPAERSEILEVADRVAHSTAEGHDVTVEHNQQVETISLAMMFQHRSPNSVDHNLQLAGQLMSAVEMAQNPLTMAAGQEAIAAVRAQVTPEQFLSGLQHAIGATKRIADLKEFFANREWFVTEQSFDKWHVSGRTTSGEYVRGFGDTKEAALAMVRRRDPNARILKVVDKQDKNDPNRTYGMPAPVLEKAAQLEQNALAAIRSDASLDPATRDRLVALYEENSTARAIRRELAASQMYKPGSERAGVAGREELPMLANHVNYHTALMRALQSKLVRAQTSLRTMSPDLVQSPEKVGLINQALENFLTPDSEWATNASRAVATYNLAYSIASMSVEAIQSTMTHLPQLIAEGGGIIGSTVRLGSAFKEIAKWGTSGKWKSPEHEEFMRRYTADLEVGYGAWDDTVANSETVVQRAKDLQNANAPRGIGSMLKSGASAYAKLGMNLYGVVTHLNARLAGLMSFDHYRAQGLDFDTAYQKAREFNRTVNFSGGKAARPVGFFNTKGGWRGASQLMYVFRGFTLGMWSTIARHIRGGFGKPAPGMSFADRVNSRKAAVVQLGTMFALAGALGMPGVEALIAVLEQTTDLKIREGIRQGTTDALGDPTLSEGFLMGIPNMLGVDAHSRVSLGGFPGLSSFDGFSLTDLAGPAYGLVERLAVGAKKTGTGQTSGAAQYVMPPAFRRLAEVLGQDSLSTGSGKLITKYTSGEKIAMGIGFTPTRVAQLKEAERIRVRSEKIDNAQTARERGQIADAYLAGDTATARELITTRVASNTRDARQESVAVAKAVEDRTFPREVRNQPGSSSSGLSQAFGQSGFVSEVQRLQLRAQVMQTLGYPVQISGRDLAKAQAIDQLLLARPSLTREAARELVEGAYSPSL